MQGRSRGFSLVELMLVVAISSIVGTTFFGVMYMQTLGYVERLDELDAHSNARAALNVIRRYVRASRWGMVSNSVGLGIVGVGKCYSDADSKKSMGGCNNLSTDGGADRMRLAYIVNDSEYVGSQQTGSANNCSTNGLDTATLIHVNQNPVKAFTVGQVLGIGGNCVSPSGSAASDLLILTSDSGSGVGCGHRYAYTLLEGGTLSCGTSGYDKGYSFGRAIVADFYVSKDPSGRPNLMLRTDPTKPIGDAFIVAYDIEDMQVKYGIDTSMPTDRSVDRWCDDPRPASGGGTSGCDLVQPLTGTPYSLSDNYNRIVAVQVSLRVRTNTVRPNILPMPLDANFTVSNPVVNPKDGYQRWLYTTTIALRNDNI